MFDSDNVFIVSLATAVVLILALLIGGAMYEGKKKRELVATCLQAGNTPAECASFTR